MDAVRWDRRGRNRVCAFLCLAGMLLALDAAFGAAARAAGLADVGNHWAAQAIERMNAKGVLQGARRGKDTVFEPERAVTRYEAVVMIVRALGLEEAARRRTAIPAAFREARSVPSWAFGAVGEAVERGILAGPDLAAFRGGAKAARVDVAGWLGRALGLGGAGGAAAPAGGAGAAPAPAFSDLEGLSPEAAAAVAAVAEAGLMAGAEGRFRPAAPVTRAEMAVLLDRVDRLTETALDANEVVGKIESKNAGLVLQVGAGQRAFGLSEDTVVYFEGMRASRAFLAAGDTVDVIGDAGARALYVEVISQPLAAEGEIAAVTGGAGATGGGVGGAALRQVQVRLDDGTVKAYALAPSALVSLDDRPAPLGRLAPGMRAALEGRGNAVTLIRAYTKVEEVRGELVALSRREGNLLLQVRVKKPGGETEDRVFSVPVTLAATRDGREAAATEVRAQDRLTLSLRGERVVRLAAESYEREAAGILKGIAFGDRVEVTVEVDAQGGLPARRLTLPVRAAVEVKKDGRTAGLTALRAGDRVRLSIVGDDVAAIAAETRRTDLEGTVVRVTIASPPEITVRTRAGEEKTFPVSPDVSIRLGSQQVALAALRPGQVVTLSLAYDQVTAISGAAQAVLDDLRGIIRYLDFQENVFVLEPAGGTGNRNVKPEAGFLIYRSGRLLDRLSQLEAGDAVVVFGRDVPGEPFRAQVIVVVGKQP